MRLHAGHLHRWLICAVPLLLLIVACTAANAAEDNPFGFPKPLDPRRPGIVMMHGGGLSQFDKHRPRVRRRFVELAGGPEARIVLMPSDTCVRGKRNENTLIDGGETREEFERRLRSLYEYGHWSNMDVKSFNFAYRDPINDSNDEQICRDIRDATGIWLPAYDQEWLPDLFSRDASGNPHPVVKELRNLLARGGVVGGLGGGMACLPETMISSDLNDDGGWTQPEVTFGLGLLDRIVVDKDFNYASGRLERLTYLLRFGSQLDRKRSIPGVESRTIGIGVSHYTVAILRPDSIEAMGENEVEVFLRSNGDRTITWHKLTDGQKISIGDSQQAASTVRPNENPFGLPEADGKASGTVVLHGGGNTDDIIAHLPSLSGHRQPNLVHCPAAKDRFRPLDEMHAKLLPAQLNDYFYEWRDLEREGKLNRLTFLTTNTAKSADSADFVKPLLQAHAVWFSGGNQRFLRDLFVGEDRETLFQEELKNVLRRGGVVGGTSAGLAMMPATIIVSGDDDNAERAELDDGFGLLKNVVADQHFDARQGRIKRLTNLLWESQQKDTPFESFGVAVNEDTALIVRPNKVAVRGTNSAHVFLRSKDHQTGYRTITWHLLHPGDEAVIRDTTDGFQLEMVVPVSRK